MILTESQFKRELAIKAAAVQVLNRLSLTHEEAIERALRFMIAEAEASLAARLCRCDANDAARSRTVPRSPDTVPLRMNPSGECPSSPGRGSGPDAPPSNTGADRP